MKLMMARTGGGGQEGCVPAEVLFGKKMLMKWNRQVDLIGGPIMKNLLIFMLPILVSYIFQQFYNAVDTAIVGHFLGEQSLAAVGANVAIVDLMVMFAQALGNGLCIVVSRAYGAGDESRLRKSVAGSLVIGAGTIAVMTALSLLGLGPLLRILGTPEAIYAEALAYIRIIGTSEYDSKQMAHFLDQTIIEAQDLGIETDTPEQIEEYKRLYEKRYGKADSIRVENPA
jgi:hypothetical protein